jgi:hypothetical protein
MKSTSFACVWLFALVISAPSQAIPINFDLIGPAVSGYIQFDDSDFDGSDSQLLSNSLITDLNLTVDGLFFDLSDVFTIDFTIIDSSGEMPRIDDGLGFLAENGMGRIWIYGQSISLSTPSGTSNHVFKQTASQVQIPLPGTVLLFGVGFLAVFRFRRKV